MPKWHFDAAKCGEKVCHMVSVARVAVSSGSWVRRWQTSMEVRMEKVIRPVVSGLFSCLGLEYPDETCQLVSGKNSATSQPCPPTPVRLGQPRHSPPSLSIPMRKKPATRKKEKGGLGESGKPQGKKAGRNKTKKQGKRATLYVERTAAVDLHEVSGICLRRGPKGGMWLMAIGDQHARLARARLIRRRDQELRWEYIDIAALPGSKMPKNDPQIEAICSDGAGRVLLLQESPPRAELVDLTEGAAGVVASFELSMDGTFGKLAKSWADPKGSRGEGAVLLPSGHLLVAKEKKPAALIEFGPPDAAPLGLARGGALRNGARWPVAAGDHQYVALAAWRPDKTLEEACEDFSDLEIGPDGNLYLLSDKSRTVARLDTLSPGTTEVACLAIWELEGVKGKPEGLAFTPRGQAVIALDHRGTESNLLLMTPALAVGR